MRQTSMPSQTIHETIDVALFGRSYPHIHRNKDYPINEYFIAHRLLHHDPFYNLLTEHPPSAFVHDITDALTLPMVPLLFVLNPKLITD